MAIKNNELRIGNYINYKGFEHSIRGIDERKVKIGFDWLDHSEFEAIQLTEEWLIKAGFKRLKKDGFSLYERNNFTFNTSHHKMWYHDFILDIQPEYLHQLQNLYLALTGTELTFNL